jgi:predicted phosphate transport protein (TIGR00153 family)
LLAVESRLNRPNNQHFGATHRAGLQWSMIVPMWFLPKNLEFFDCFDRAAKNAVRSAEILAELSTVVGDRRLKLVDDITNAEHEGDRITSETLKRLEQTYITPIDRDDIHDLITRLDDVVDMIEAVARRMMLYKIGTARKEFIDQCQVLVKASRLMAEAVNALHHLKGRRRPKDAATLEELLLAVHAAEEEGDAIHHQFLAVLFDCGLDAFQVIKLKELHHLVEEAIDYCDDVANVVHRIELKNL